MRRCLWLAPLLTGALLVGCSAARPPESPPAEEKRAEAPQTPADRTETGAAATAALDAAAAGAVPLRTGSVSMDLARLKQLQAEVDAGHKPGNLNPEEVVREGGRALGLNPAGDTVHLEKMVARGQGSGTGEAYVYVLHAGREYVVQLIQPVKTGAGGIWAINSIRDIGSKSDNDAKFASLQRYFEALATKDYRTAYELMSRRFRQGLAGPDGLAGNAIAAFEGAERLAWASPGPDSMYVEIRLKLAVQGGSAWGDGANGRYASFVEEDGAWHIDALATSP